MLSSADIVVIPSRYESFGLVAIEAMAAGAPVVGLRTSGLAEIVAEGVSGRLVEVDGREVEGILAALISIIRDRSLRHKLASGARELFERRFTSDIMIDGIERTFQAVIREKTIGT
jgi:glycosyltransferase involved in cell wall biosynthesis